MTPGAPFLTPENIASLRQEPAWILKILEHSVTGGCPLSRQAGKDLCALSGLLYDVPPKQCFPLLNGILVGITLEDLLRFGPIFAGAIPELEPCLGFQQHSPHHRFDLYTHIAHVTAQVPGDLPLRWAALLHDIGKASTFTLDETGRGHFKGHAQKGAPIAEGILRRMGAPEELCREVSLLVLLHMKRLTPEEDVLRQDLALYGKDTLNRLLLLQQADMNSKGIPGEEQTALFRTIAQMLSQMEG